MTNQLRTTMYQGEEWGYVVSELCDSENNRLNLAQQAVFVPATQAAVKSDCPRSFTFFAGLTAGVVGVGLVIFGIVIGMSYSEHARTQALQNAEALKTALKK